MLTREAMATRDRRWRRLGVVVIGGAALWLGVRATREVPRPLIVMPAPIVPAPVVVIEVEQPPAPLPLPASLPAPAPAPAPDPEPTLVSAPAGTTCPRDLATIGLPFAIAIPDPAAVAGEAGEVIVSATGCAIATTTARGVVASFDGGQTFVARLVAPGTLSQVALDADRIAALRDRQTLGIEHADGTVVWRALPAGLDPTMITGLAMGGGLVALTYRSEPRSLIAVSADDGATWRTEFAPVDGLAWVSALAATRIELTVERAPPDSTDGGDGWQERYAARPGRLSWRRDEPRASSSWRYQIVGDEFWGCGGTAKLLAIRDGRTATVQRGIQAEVIPFELAARGSVAYVVDRDHLYRLRGTRRHDLGPLPMGEVFSLHTRVDGADTFVTSFGGHLLRFTPQGGWRVLN
ncbi:MAG: hypothetical protein IPL61_36800 [Myxococcales bacterium]|nr:hypothetical protein [Myxococcales bacterium]